MFKKLFSKFQLFPSKKNNSKISDFPLQEFNCENKKKQHTNNPIKLIKYKFVDILTKRNGLEDLNLPVEIENIILDYKNQLETTFTYEDTLEYAKKVISRTYDNVKPSLEHYSDYTKYSFI